ncbi:MAG: LPS-assembly protein LptD [Bacteroidota bacterium]|nr:LPS-assembly protein LptD [Bacteroidota bacterium]
MTNDGKINVKRYAGIMAVCCMLIFSLQLKALKHSSAFFVNSLTSFNDTVPAKKDTLTDTVNITDADTLVFKKKDTTLTTVDTINVSKDSLDAPVKYTAADSGVLIIPSKEFILYGKANTHYKDLELEAATIRYDQQSQMIRAYGGTDTSNSPLNKPKFTQGEMKSVSDTISFNMKTMKGRTTNTFYQEGELFVNAQVLKKVDKDIFYGYRGRFTTCNLDTPHFAFRTRKLKMINDKLAVSGPTSAEVEGIPIPIGIPFGIFPLYRGRHSGIMAPQFTMSEDFGMGLEGLGYYKVLSDNADVTLRSNLYSYGGWMLSVNPKYLKRYHYTGAFNLTLQKTVMLNRNTYSPDEFTKSSSFMLNWTHTRDSKARPGTSFSANVNFGSTKFNQYLLNNPYQNYQNQLSSSISYTKDFKGKANLSLSFNHNQNNNTRLVNMNLPNVTMSVVTFYPFQKKDKVGTPKWYENIGIGYSGNIQNQVSFYDSAVTFKKILDTLQWGAQHSIPISLTLPQLGPFTLSPSVSYQERWYGQKIFRRWDSVNERLDTSIQKGFYTGREMSFGMSVSTRIFGTYALKHAKIRHEVRPSISFTYKPDLSSQYYYNVKIDSFGHYMRYSQFDGAVPGPFSEGNFGGISFGIDNLLEMKVKDKKDTSATATKKIKLLDGFGFNSSYNLMADSFALAPFNLYARSTLFDKINITASATLDPYQADSLGYRKNVYAWNGPHPTLGRITSGNIALSTQFKSKSKSGKDDKDTQIPVDPFMTPDEQQRQLQFARANPAEYTDFDIPWSINLSYSLSFTKQLMLDTDGKYVFGTMTYSSVNFNGDFSLTPKWKMGGNGYLDLKTRTLQQFSMFISREMHCWQLSINVTPIGLYRSFNITFNPKSGILRDLRINRARTFSNSPY